MPNPVENNSTAENNSTCNTALLLGSEIPMQAEYLINELLTVACPQEYIAMLEQMFYAWLNTDLSNQKHMRKHFAKLFYELKEFLEQTESIIQ